MNVPWCARVIILVAKILMIKINPNEFLILKTQNDTCPQSSFLIFKHVSYFD